MNAADEIRSAIETAGGAIPFAAFMRLALYGADGFYTRSDDEGRAGRRGDFITSPEVGPLFGAVIARRLDAEWARLDRPTEFTVVDAGAGPGTLARSVLAAAPTCLNALRYVAVELSASQRARHPTGIDSQPELPASPFDGVVLANELLDNLPFALAVFDGGWREAFVASDGGDRFVEVLPQPIVAPTLPVDAPHGARAPVQLDAAGWVEAARALVRRGCVVAIDYARPTTAALAAMPWREWLRTYRGHGRGGHYLDLPGGQDITADVAVDQLAPPDTVRTQAQFLHRWGIDELVEEGRRTWATQAARPDLRALAMRSRIREADALLDPAGLGAFTVLEWRSW